MPISSQLTPSISTQPLQNYQALHSISKAEPRQPSEESHFYCLYLQSNSFRQFPQLMDIGVGRNIDRSVNRNLCFPSLFTTTDHSSTGINLSVPSLLDKTPRYFKHCTFFQFNYSHQEALYIVRKDPTVIERNPNNHTGENHSLRLFCYSTIHCNWLHAANTTCYVNLVRMVNLGLFIEPLCCRLA